MQHETDFFESAGYLELYYQRWQPDTGPRAVIVLVHGVAEHSDRYANIVGPLTVSGYAVYGYDQRGHGRSPGQRVYVNRWAEYREDLKAFVDLVHRQAPGKPVFLYGHSMGGLIALDHILHHPQDLQGTILSSPTLKQMVSKPYHKPLAWVLTRLSPHFSMKTNLDVSVLSRDPQVGQVYAADPLVTRRATVRWFAEMLDAIAYVQAHAPKICLPVLLTHGEADQLNHVQGTRDLFQAITHPDKTLRIYPAGYHEPHNDINHPQVIADILTWLDQHC